MTRRNLVLLCVAPAITLVLVWTDELHHLIRAREWLDTGGSYAVLGRTFGPWFWLHVAYSYAAVATAIALLIGAIRSAPVNYRNQPITLLMGFLAPFVWNVVFVLVPGVMPRHDFTPAAFGLAGIIVAWGLFRFRLFTVVPVARDALVDSMTDGILVLDDADRVVDLNETARNLIGQPYARILAHPLANTWTAWPQLAAPYLAGAERTEISVGQNDDIRRYEVKISQLAKRERLLGRLLVIRDVTEQALLEESLRRQAVTDSLTGLPNRTLFMARLDDAVRQAKRYSDTSFAVIVLDLDRFKLVNDNIGHLAGDVLIETVAAKLKRCVRDADTVARLGGDEFMILVNEIASTRDVLPVLERIQEELRTPVHFRQHEMIASASMGVVIWEDTYQDPEEILRAADTAMYQAKEAGRACYRIFDEQMHRAALQTLKAETDLRAAIANGDFSLLYQPIVELRTGEVVSLEALIRWHHPERGVVFPNEFITMAENSGLIVPLGLFALEEVCSQISRWRSPGSPAAGLPVSLNISPRQLAELDFVAMVRARLDEWRISPESLIFEFTEAAFIHDHLNTTQMMRQLREMGIRLCLDDFGTGWSSLRHLTSYPVQELKIDNSYVSKIAKSNTEFEIVRSITALAHTLGLTVTGEGVKRKEEWQLLETLGCDKVQGYFVGRPMTPNELLAYFEQPSHECACVHLTKDALCPGDREAARDVGALVWYHPTPLYNE